jgi:signal transduction histidine kinase
LAHGHRSCWSTPIFSRSGQVLGACAILQDEPGCPTAQQQDLIGKVTHIASLAIERAQRDAALRSREVLLLEAQRLSSTGSFSWYVANDEITWSEQLYRIFELDQGVPVTFALIGSRVHPEDLASMHDMLERARRAGADIEHEFRLLMPDHSLKYVRMVARAVRDQDGWFEYIGAIQDVTQRRIAEEALGKARSELAHVARIMSLGALTASIAHEVNQPLSGIITNAGTCLRMLTAEPPDMEGARETARRALRDGNRAAEVITRLRALFGKQDAKTERVDLNAATREVIALSLSELQRNRVMLRTELAEDLPRVTGDRVQLQQVILNLLLNASHAMRGVEVGSRLLLIKTERDPGNRVRLSVKDTGVGMEAQVMARLFEPFHTTKGEGMGIGLFVSRSIIESHQGCLQVTTNDGPGVTFSFSVPPARRHPSVGMLDSRAPALDTLAPDAVRMRAMTGLGRVMASP